MIDSAGLRRIATSFLASKTPAMVLSVPGCREIFVNQMLADYEASKPRAGTTNHQLVTVATAQEFVDASIAAWNELPRYAREDRELLAMDLDSALEKATRCFCERWRAFVALRFSECPYETQFSNLIEGFASGPMYDFDFFYSGTNGHGSRVYQVARVFTRLLGEVRPTEYGSRGLILIRFVMSEHAELLVSGDRHASRFQPRMLVNGMPGRAPLLWFEDTEGRTVSRESYPSYVLMDSWLQRAAEDPSHARTYLAEALTAMKSEFGDLYPAYLTLLGGVLEFEHDQDRFVTEVNRLRDRLYDGPVLGEFVRNELTRQLYSDDIYLPFAETLEMDQRADVGRLRMTFDQMESRDRLQGFFPLPPGYSIAHSR